MKPPQWGPPVRGWAARESTSEVALDTQDPLIPASGTISFYGYGGGNFVVAVPVTPEGWENNGFGPIGSVNVGPVVAYNVFEPDDYEGAFYGGEVSVISPSRWGGYVDVAGGPPQPGEIVPDFTGPWAVSGGISYGTPGVSVIYPGLTGYLNPDWANIEL